MVREVLLRRQYSSKNLKLDAEDTIQKSEGTDFQRDGGMLKLGTLVGGTGMVRHLASPRLLSPVSPQHLSSLVTKTSSDIAKRPLGGQIAIGSAGGDKPQGSFQRMLGPACHCNWLTPAAVENKGCRNKSENI